MRDLPPAVARAVEAEVADVEDQLRHMPTVDVLQEEDLAWFFTLDDGWHMYVEVDNNSLRVVRGELLLDVTVSVGRGLARPRIRRPLRLPLRPD